MGFADRDSSAGAGAGEAGAVFAGQAVYAGTGVQDEQPFLYQAGQLHLPQLGTQAQQGQGQGQGPHEAYSLAQEGSGIYATSASHLPVETYAPLESVQPFQAQPHLDASGRRFSLPAYHPSHYASAPYDAGHARMASHASGYSAEGNLLDPNAMMGPTTDDLVSPISSNQSPSFAGFEGGYYNDGAELSPSSSAEELAGSQDYGQQQQHLQQQHLSPQQFGYNGNGNGQQNHYVQQQQQQQQQPAYSMASYTFGAPTPHSADPSIAQFGHSQDLAFSPDPFGTGNGPAHAPLDHGHDLARRASLNTAFNGLGLASPAQHAPAPGWGAAAQGSYLAPQVAQGGVPLTAAAHQALMQKRHSVAAPSMGGYSMGAGAGGGFVPNGAGLAGLNGQGLPAYGQGGQQQFLGPSLSAGQMAMAAGRRGSTSSLLGTIAEQPRGAYGLPPDAGGESGEAGPGLAGLERRGSLAGPTARKARSQTQLRGSPYGHAVGAAGHGVAGEATRRSPGVGGGELRRGSVGVEYGGY